MDNLIAKKDEADHYRSFITTGARESRITLLNNRDANNRSVAYDSLGPNANHHRRNDSLKAAGKITSQRPEGRASADQQAGPICAFKMAWAAPINSAK